MKTKELIKKIQRMGYYANTNGEYLEIYEYNVSGIENTIAEIGEWCELSLNTNFEGFEYLSEDEKGRLFEVLYEYVRTPIRERKETENTPEIPGQMNIEDYK